MGIKIMGGYDSATGWPPDDSTGVEFQDDVDIPGQFRGGGAGFGPGGFRGSPRVTAPASGPPPGTSISGVPGGGGASASGGGWGWPGAATLLNRLPLPPIARGAIAGAGIMAPTPAQGPGLTPEQMAHGPSDPADLLPPQPAFQPNYVRPEGQIQRQFPPWSTPGDHAGAAPYNMVRPEGEIQRTFPMWSTPPAPAPEGIPRGMPGRAVTPPATYPHMPWPDTGVAPPSDRTGAIAPRATPRAAGPAAARQQPNLGNYAPPLAPGFTTFDRPNMSPQNSARGRQGAEQMGMLDLSRLFGGGAPAVNPNVPAAAAAPAAAVRRVPPSVLSRAPGPMDPSIIARQKMKRSKSSTTSQGGGY
jgi:hypothetical protein